MFIPGADAQLGRLIAAWDGVPFPGSSSVQPVVLEESIQLVQPVDSFLELRNTEVQTSLITTITGAASTWSLDALELPEEPVWILGVTFEEASLANLERGSLIHNAGVNQGTIVQSFRGSGNVAFRGTPGVVVSPSFPAEWPRQALPYLALPSGTGGQSLELHVLSNAGGSQTLNAWIQWATAREPGAPIISPR